MKFWKAIRYVMANKSSLVLNSHWQQVSWKGDGIINILISGGGRNVRGFPPDGWNIVLDVVTWSEASKAWSEGETVVCYGGFISGNGIYIYSNPDKFVDKNDSPVHIDLIKSGTWYLMSKVED